MKTDNSKSTLNDVDSDATKLVVAVNSANQLLSILGRISDGVVALDRGWNYTYANDAAAKMLQRNSPDDLIGRHIWTEFPEGAGQSFHRAYEAALENQELIVFEEYFEPWDKWFENRIYPSPDGLTIYFSETTAQVKAAIALRQSAAVFSNTKDSVVISDVHSIITNVNPSFLNATGYSEAEIVSQSMSFLFDEIQGNPIWADVATIDSWSGSIAGRRKDGSQFPQLGSKETLFNRHNVKEGSIFIASDLTETRQRESVEKQLAQAQKMEAIGNLTGGVAHDFNNLLAVVLGNLELVRDTDVTKAQLGFIDASIAASMRGADLTKNMLSFARRAPLDPTELDLNAIVRDTSNWAGRTLPANIEIETSLLAGLWPIEADASSTENSLLNLILNARDAMSQGGKLTIETSNVRADEEYSHARDEGMDIGRYVLLAVSDTGHGISADDLKQIFDPFFTTKQLRDGSGLGLSMIQGFMDQSGGTVRVYSEPNLGTTFKLYFKVHPGKVLRQNIESDESKVEKTDGVHLLLVEDEPEVLSVLFTTLSQAGYNVRTATSGDSALDIFEEESDFDLLLTDIVMPGELQGTTLARELRKRQPDLPVVFMSGYASEATVHGNGLRPEDIRLMKPVRRADLLLAIEKALSES